MNPCKAPEITVRSNGIGFTGLLALLFIGLKLGGIISWSWWYVLAPLWMPFALAVVPALLVLVIGVAVCLLSALFGKRENGK